ncbi:telomerase Cajal body protein 1-like [Oppia nitens]|uniref:telomerase Cajal body protein 1-like n=1 Tax=Oppia nitens TaxID=1686743 RepID=UPI0023DA5743|nr:telomerase Cajal body protein 1-like [Oppia nitens]XP_054168672.1 telomerase Cajal body protein 1-like [Oppia nitens]
MEDIIEEPSHRLNQLLDETTIQTSDDSDGQNKCDYDWTKSPKLINKCFNQFNDSNNCLKGCKWSPDGSCLMTNSDDHCLRLFNLPQNLCQNPIILDEDVEEMSPVLKIKESEIIYDFCWYPLMNSCHPSTCLLMTTSRDNPIHLWDAYTGQLVCTYRAYNYADEVIAANCVAFSADGTKIYSGFEKWIRVFDTSSPGRVCDSKQTYMDKTGQKGIISCIAVNPLNPNIIAFGSYDKSIGLYEEPSLVNICVLMGQKGGLTHIQFSADGHRLYSGGRKDSEILCWDIRNVGQVLSVITRSVNTNQRVYFDLSCDSKYLATGSDNGMVYIYDTKSDDINDDILKSCNSFEAHNDCANGVAFHPTLPLLSTTSGQRRFADVSDSEDEDLSLLKTKQENSLKFWWNY